MTSIFFGSAKMSSMELCIGHTPMLSSDCAKNHQGPDASPGFRFLAYHRGGLSFTLLRTTRKAAPKIAVQAANVKPIKR